jgi:hypothetical protein
MVVDMVVVAAEEAVVVAAVVAGIARTTRGSAGPRSLAPR